MSETTGEFVATTVESTQLASASGGDLNGPVDAGGHAVSAGDMADGSLGMDDVDVAAAAGDVAHGLDAGDGAEDASADAGAEPGEAVDAEEVTDEEASDAGTRRRPTLRRLEEEGEVAADYLEELLDIADLDGDIDIDVENERASVAIVAEGDSARDLRRLVGSHGEVLEALQELSRLAVQARTGERSRLMLDVAGFRVGLRRKIEDLAARACQEVQRTGQPVKLDPMNAFERKVAHDLVAEAGLASESEGEDPHRRVVIHPAHS